MERVDLDALDLAAGYVDDHTKELIWDAVAELRAARERIDDYENAITWGTSCTSCARVLDASIADQAEAELLELRRRYGTHDDNPDEVWCGARRDQAGSAYCVEMAGHHRDGYPHMWNRPATADQPPGDG